MATAKVRCWMCGAEIFADAFRCPECGAPPPERRQREQLKQQAEKRHEVRQAARVQQLKVVEKEKARDFRRAIKQARATGDLRALPADVQEQLANEVMITTESTPIGLFIKQRLGIVSAEKMFGMNLMGDAHATIGEVSGARTDAALRALKNARADCIGALRREAMIASADAVIAIRFEHGDLGNSMYLMTASGTAVRLKKG